MRIRRPWQVVAGAGTAAAVVGLGATAVAASGGIELNDRDGTVPESVSVETTDGPEKVIDSPADSVHSADSPSDSPSDSPADSPSDSPAEATDSAESANSAASADSADSAD